MANALPDNVRTNIITNSAQSNTVLVKEGQANFQNTNNLVRASATKQLDELGVTEGRAVDKVMQLPTEEG